MDRKIKYLAKCRQVEAEYQAQVTEAETDLKESAMWRWIEQRRSFLATAKADTKDAEADVREAALKTHTETGDTKPHPAVQIKQFTVVMYNAVEALDYARQHLASVVKLDRRAFEKAAKVLELSFVTITKQPRATIARDLSEWLAGEMGDTEEAGE